MTKCKCNDCSCAKPKIDFTPLKTEKTWTLIKDVSAQRIEELKADPIRSEKLCKIIDDMKEEIMVSLCTKFAEISNGNNMVPADDVLTVLTTATMSMALDLFETNQEVMDYLNLPDENELVGQPLSTDNTSIYR